MMYCLTNKQGDYVGVLRARYFPPNKYTVCWPQNYRTGYILTEDEVIKRFKHLGFMKLFSSIAISKRMERERKELIDESR